MFSLNACETPARVGRLPAGGCALPVFRVEPGPELPPAHRPRPERKEAAYFENEELPRLFAYLEDAPSRTLCLVALKTGMRQGELLGLRWSDVDLEQAVVRVRRSYTGGTVSTPKNPERRDVDLISDVVELLTRWRREGRSASYRDSLVFPGNDGLAFSDAVRSPPTAALPGHGAREHPTGRADAGEADVPQFQAHICETRVGEGCSDHLAVTPPRPLLAQGDNGYLWSLGARRAKAASGQDGGCVSGMRTL